MKIVIETVLCTVWLLWHTSREGLHWSWHSSHWYLWRTWRKFIPLRTHFLVNTASTKLAITNSFLL